LTKTIGISGAGLVGSLLSVYLAKRGYQVEVYERRPDMRRAEMSAGRSINLALSDRGWKALEGVKMTNPVKNIAIPMYGRMIHDEDGTQRFMPYGKEDQGIYSVSRGELNKLLMTEAEQFDKVHFYFNQKCTNVDLEQPALTFQDGNTQTKKTRQFSRIFGTDGAFSSVREVMMKAQKRFNYSQEFIEHGYKELHIPPGDEEPWQLYKNALHIWPRKSFMMIALPNLDGSFTVTLFLGFHGSPSFEELQTDQDIKDFFHQYFSDAMALMPSLLEDFHNNPTDSLVTIRCNPYHYQDKACLLGDAAHAIVPFYGQGMNAGFEDCTLIDQILNQHEGNWERIFQEVSKQRVPDGHAIADLALHNFIEMRDLVADPHFIKKRDLSRQINDLFPDEWIPLYSMVTFSHMSYAEAKKQGDEHDLILDDILDKYDYEKITENPEYLKEIVKPYL